MKTIKQKVFIEVSRRWCSNAYLNRTCSFGGSTAERKLRELKKEIVLNKRTKTIKENGKIVNTFYEWKVAK